jgi:DNA-binding beta-propeller fold protein YncE
MKIKTVFIWMGISVTLAVALFVGVSLYNYQSKVEKVANPIINRDGPPVFNYTIYGNFDEALDKPMDVSKVGEYIYVSDTNNKRVQVFDQAGTPLFKFGKEGRDEGEFMFPYGITGDKQGNVYVADLYNGKISIHDSKGSFIKYFKEADEKQKAIKAPGAIRIFEEKLYVTDIEKSKVFVFGLDGKKLLEIGKTGMEDGQFRAPNGITVDRDGKIYVVDTGNQRLQIFDKNGKFLKSMNGSKDGKGSSLFVNPRGVGVDSDGTIYVVNNLTHFVYGFDQEGNKVFEFGGMGDQNEQLYLPNGLWVDENDYLYITDTLNQRVVVYY